MERSYQLDDETQSLLISVKDIVLRLFQGETPIRTTTPELPVWHLGGVGALHRLLRSEYVAHL